MKPKHIRVVIVPSFHPFMLILEGFFVCSILIIMFSQLSHKFSLIFSQFKEGVARFAQENIAPHAAKIDRTNYFPEVVWDNFSLSFQAIGRMMKFDTMSSFRRLTCGN